MIYTFTCECGYSRSVQRSIHEGPPAEVACPCGRKMDRDWKADAPMLDTAACRDHSDIPYQKRVASAWDRGTPGQVESQFKRHVEGRRKEIRDAGGQRGSFRQTHSVPAHLYHGKIKETGDKNYWNDPKNLSRHNECKVDNG